MRICSAALQEGADTGQTETPAVRVTLIKGFGDAAFSQKFSSSNTFYGIELISCTLL